MQPGIQYHCPHCDHTLELDVKPFNFLIKNQHWACEHCQQSLQISAEDQNQFIQRIGRYRGQASKHILPSVAMLLVVMAHLYGLINNAMLGVGFVLCFIGLVMLRRFRFAMITLKVEPYPTQPIKAQE